MGRRGGSYQLLHEHIHIMCVDGGFGGLAVGQANKFCGYNNEGLENDVYGVNRTRVDIICKLTWLFGYAELVHFSAKYTHSLFVSMLRAWIFGL